MGLQYEDRTPLDISGDPAPTRPLTNAEVAGTQKAKANQNRPQVPSAPKGQPPPSQKNGGVDRSKEPESKSGQSQSQIQSEMPQAPSGEHGAGPALNALIGGMGDVFNDPEWMRHPLLRLFSDNTDDPKQLGQDLWGATQWWGRVVNAAFDPNAIQASFQNIATDNSIGGKIKQRLTGVNTQDEWAWGAMSYVLAAGAEWEPWMWVPSLAAQGPGQLNQVPGAIMGLFGNDLKHPAFQDPEWYARMGSYALAAVIATKTGGKGVGPLLKFSGRLKALEPFVAKADRLLGGPGEKTPIKGPDGQMYDPNADPTGHAHAQWWNDNLAPVEEAESVIGKAASKEETQLVSHPDIEGAYLEQRLDPEAKTDFARLLGLDAKATTLDIKDKFFAMVEGRELSPRLSAEITKNWDRFGSVIGMRGHIKYWHAGEAPLRNVLTSLNAITDPERKAAAEAAMRAANGFRADLHKGIHGYGNDLSEALVKGVLSHGRSSNFYLPRVASFFQKALPTAAERSRVSHAIEAFNISPEEGQAAYDALTEHEKWGVDFYRRLAGEVRAAKAVTGVSLEAQPNFFYRVPALRANLEAVLKGIPEALRREARVSRGNTPFGHVSRQHRAFQLVSSPEGELRAEPAYPTTKAANAQRAEWREQIKEDLKMRAVMEPAFKAIVNDPAKLDALAYAEIPDFSTDVLDSLLGVGDRGLAPDAKALFTQQVLESAKRTLMLGAIDGRDHPLAVARNEAGQESSDTLSDHFKYLHSADTTTDFYKSEGWKPIDGFGQGYIFHPSFADPINTSLRYARGDADGAMKYLLKAAGVGKKFIMLNPLWHSTNMAGRFAWLSGTYPREVADALLKARGLKGLTPAQSQEWWDAMEHEFIEHGGLPPQLNEDVTASAGRYHSLATGDVETGQPMGGKEPVAGFMHDTGLAGALNAVKGVDAWWQNHVNGHMWTQIHNFGVLAYIALKDDFIKRGMSPGDARITAASQANSWAGMVSPDRWMYSPSMHNLSQLLLFAPNWWRTFPRIILNSYDRMGLKSSPALTNAWALNTAKTIGMMILLKGATDNALNWLMSGHWQFQNPDGYKNQITMDRFRAEDPKTGAHLVMENPFERQTTDLERALGLEEAMKMGQWKPEYAEEGVAEVLAARASPLLQALETGSNFDLYNTIKQRALRWVDPTHPNVFGSLQSAGAGILNLSPVGYGAQAAVSGATAQPQTLNWGPFAGTQVPGWAARAFDPNDPLVPLLSLLGVRGGYPSPIRSDERGLSSDEIQQITKVNNDWNSKLAKQQQQVMTGGETFADFAYWYRQNASYHAGELAGITGNTSEYMQGAEGLLSQYEAIYNQPGAFDANGDVNWAYITKQQDQLQGKTDPATWRQMQSLLHQRELQFPVLRAYKDSLQNYHNFQDSWAHQNGSDGERLRELIAQGASAPDFQRFESEHPLLAQYYNAKRQWELDTKQGFAYGLFTNNTYVMRVIAPSGDTQQAASAEEQILKQIEQSEQAGTFVTPSGQ